MKLEKKTALVLMLLVVVGSCYLFYLKNKYKTIISGAKDSKESYRLIKNISHWDAFAIDAIEISLLILSTLLGFALFIN